jgi:hypothetical protein
MANLILELVSGKGALPLLLGASRGDIARTMLNLGHDISAQRDAIDYYVRNSVQIEFDEDGFASFIGISSDAGMELIYHGSNILHLPSRKVFDLIKENEPEHEIEYSSTEHIFRSQIITLWDADEQYNKFDAGFPVWAQIGIGNETYLAAIEGLPT